MTHFKYYILFLIVPYMFLLSPLTFQAWGRDFVVVIDPGHGGRDPGAVGKVSQEKAINLKVALKLGEMINWNCKDVKVVYTRDKDVYLTLNRRAEIANHAKADLFISIHTNAVKGNQSPRGASTWTLGLAKSDANLEVAKRENSVILLESDYQQRYAGFNPGSSESYIIFEFMQDKYMEQSVHLADLIQKEFRTTCKRPDRGVHQAGFLVLKESAMPSVLVELGFISNPEEERYLNSAQGVENLAGGIYRAFLTYKKEHDIRAGGKEYEPAPRVADKSVPASEKKVTQGIAGKNNSSAPVFKVQILTSSTPLKDGDKRFKGVAPVDHYQEGWIYKYTHGASTDYNEIVRTRRKLQATFKDCFIIAFKEGNKTDVNQAIAEFKRNRK
ncbi:MAG: N-acetylmuramoyl-L-alanine amidase [Bacteroides sp.]|nr:N-acetylmuramoyl-L-alanine amidase [Bacteroides sp.]